MIVYLITNLVNDKVYVGYTEKSIAHRWHQHLDDSKRSGLYFHNAIIKYGKESFVISVLAEAETVAEIKSLEKLWILTLGSFNPEIGYNMTYGGDGHEGFTHHTDESRKKISAAKKGVSIQPHTDEHKEKIGAANKGKRMTYQQCLNISLAKKGKPGKANFAGHKHTDESKKKISESGKGLKRSDEFGAFISQRNVGNKNRLGKVTPESTRLKQAEGARRRWAERKAAS